MLQVIINGLLIGGVYAMTSVGLTIIFGVMKIVNFAQGDLLMLGMYATLIFFPTLGSHATPYPLILPVCIVMMLIGMIIFKSSISKVVGKGDTNYIVLTLGLSYFIQNVVQLFFGANFHSLPVSDGLKYGSIELGSIVLMWPRVIAFVVALISVLIMTVILNRTYLGRAMRSTAEDRNIAASLGVNTSFVYTVTFAMGAVFAGLSGLLLTPMFSIYPRAGVLFSSIAMTVVVLGGLGNITGALVGGLLVGLVESFVSVYVNLEMATVAISATLLLILMFKPTGLFGGGVRRA